MVENCLVEAHIVDFRGIQLRHRRRDCHVIGIANRLTGFSSTFIYSEGCYNKACTKTRGVTSVTSKLFNLSGILPKSISSKTVSPLWQAALLTLLIIGSIVESAHAQSTDITAPVLLLDEIDQGVLGETQVFSARVTDDVALKSVTLFHRLSGDEAYIASSMNQVGSSDVFAVSLPSTTDDIRDIEYYLQVEDTGGNIFLCVNFIALLIIDGTLSLT